MDRSAFFWQIQDGKLPPPRAAATLGISIREVSPEAGTIEVEFEGKPGPRPSRSRARSVVTLTPKSGRRRGASRRAERGRRVASFGPLTPGPFVLLKPCPMESRPPR